MTCKAGGHTRKTFQLHCNTNEGTAARKVTVILIFFLKRCSPLYSALWLPLYPSYRLEWLQVQLYSDDHRSRQAQISPPVSLGAKPSCVPPFTVWLWLNTIHPGFADHVDLDTRRDAVTCVETRATPVIFTGRLINRWVWVKHTKNIKVMSVPTCDHW